MRGSICFWIAVFYVIMSNALLISVLLFPAIFVLYLLRIGWCDDKYLNPEWKAPHAWGNHREATNEGNHREATNEAPKEECRIADSELRECTDSRIALNKLVTFLFDRDNYGVSYIHARTFGSKLQQVLPRLNYWMNCASFDRSKKQMASIIAPFIFTSPRVNCRSWQNYRSRMIWIAWYRRFWCNQNLAHYMPSTSWWWMYLVRGNVTSHWTLVASIGRSCSRTFHRLLSTMCWNWLYLLLPISCAVDTILVFCSWSSEPCYIISICTWISNAERWVDFEWSQCAMWEHRFKWFQFVRRKLPWRRLCNSCMAIRIRAETARTLGGIIY